MILSDFSLYCLLESYKNEEINKNIEKYKEKNGLKSVFFGVDIKYQKKGIGNKMIEYVKENYNHFDYLLGIQHKAISNMDFFLNRRNVVSEIENSIYTAQELN